MSRRPWLLALLLLLWAFPPAAVSAPPLRSISADDDENLVSLEQVKGMGPHKVKLYGTRFLEAINS